MDIQLGNDGQYAICYKSIKTPDRLEEIKKFQPYGLHVRVDQEKCWVFLRSTNLDDIKQCMSELGDVYRFLPVKNSHKRQEFVSQEEAVDKIRVYETVVFNLPTTFAAGRIKELCAAIDVVPVAAFKHFTKKLKTPYCSVYVRTIEEVNTLCTELNGIMYDNKCMIVKEANYLI